MQEEHSNSNLAMEIVDEGKMIDEGLYSRQL
jgi:hypothetical protein